VQGNNDKKCWKTLLPIRPKDLANLVIFPRLISAQVKSSRDSRDSRRSVYELTVHDDIDDTRSSIALLPFPNATIREMDNNGFDDKRRTSRLNHNKRLPHYSHYSTSSLHDFTAIFWTWPPGHSHFKSWHISSCLRRSQDFRNHITHNTLITYDTYERYQVIIFDYLSSLDFQRSQCELLSLSWVYIVNNGHQS